MAQHNAGKPQTKRWSPDRREIEQMEVGDRTVKPIKERMKWYNMLQRVTESHRNQGRISEWKMQAVGYEIHILKTK